MRKCLLFLILIDLLVYAGKLSAQSSLSTLDVVCWDPEWLGDTFGNGPPDKDLKEANVKKIMRCIDADLYGLAEIVDSMRVRRLVYSLGNSVYGFVISPFCSDNTTGTGASWLNGQKQAFIYRKSIFSNVTVRGLLRTSSNAYTNWASGRFLYMLSATVSINSINKSMNFIVIHGKSGSTASDYDRRKGGAQELKDTLDAQVSTTTNFIIGDFNDAFNTSIYAGAGGVSSFISIVADSTDGDHYKSFTLPPGNAGQTS